MTDSGCQQCGENTYSNGAASSCTSCPDGKVAEAESSSIEECYYGKIGSLTELRPFLNCMSCVFDARVLDSIGDLPPCQVIKRYCHFPVKNPDKLSPTPSSYLNHFDNTSTIFSSLFGGSLHDR